MSSVLATPLTTGYLMIILCGIMAFVSVWVDFSLVMQPMFFQNPVHRGYM